MKKIGLLVITFFVVACVVVISCDKAVKVPVSYTVVTNHATTVSDIFIPDSGQFDMQILVKFLSGYAQDNVTLKISGLPADISVTPDSFSAVPSYVEDFVFSTNHAAHNTYRITITGYAPEETPQTYSFNLTVIPADCATSLLGSLSGHNACEVSGNTSYTSTGVASGTANTLIVNNFAGYGTATNATVVLNCDNDSLSVPNQNIGNGTVLSGYGTFTATGMTIYFSATSTPTGPADNCTVTYSK